MIPFYVDSGTMYGTVPHWAYYDDGWTTFTNTNRERLYYTSEVTNVSLTRLVTKPPKNWRWYNALRRQPGEPESVALLLPSRPARAQARACRIDALRWKRRQWLHALAEAA